MIVYVFTHSFSCLTLQFIPPPPFIVYAPALSEIWASDQGRNPVLYTRTFGGKNCKTFFSVAKLFPFKLDQYRKENSFCSSHVKDTENVFTVLVNDVGRA